MIRPILPGSWIGLYGGGQLGRMFAFEAKRMGYRVAVLTESNDDPAAQICDKVSVASYDDEEAARRFAEAVSVITYEFEGIPAGTLRAAQEVTPVFPSPDILEIVQNRIREKEFLERSGFATVKFRHVATDKDICRELSDLRMPVVLKSAAYGYDGKGQQKLLQLEEAPEAHNQIGGDECIAEEWIELDKECSVIAVRDQYGGLTSMGPFENRHSNHILDTSVYPASIDSQLAEEAMKVAQGIAEKMKLIGVLCVEFFIERSGRLLVNEIAPRPHNSGHLTIEAFTHSQFEQQVRTICGHHVVESRSVSPAAMANLLGDLWQNGDPNWGKAIVSPSTYLHLYGKDLATARRKMGHVTCLADSAERALSNVLAVRSELSSIPVGKIDNGPPGSA